MRLILVVLLCCVIPAVAFAEEKKPDAAKPAAGTDPKPAVDKQPDAKKPAKGKKAPEKEAAPKGLLPEAWMAKMQWRPIGPANMGGRITSLSVYEEDPTLWFAATASGGLLKTENNGVTFEHQFDKEAVVSLGDVAVSQSDPKVVWVGTGECNPRNSVSWGNGVYKSTDGGKSWKHMGLKGSFQISAVRIHPKDPNVVYVGALGRLWGTNEERGLFKTTDGGKTWKKLLYVDDKTGVIDVQMHPANPDTLLVATYERQRDGFDTNDPAKKWGPGSGLYKTTDGGATFSRVTDGLPTGKLGRVGIDYYRKDPNIVYMVLESEKIGGEPENAPYMGITGRDAEVGARLTSIVKGGPSEKAGLKKDDIVIGIDGKTIHSYNEMLRAIRQHAAGDTVKVEVSRARKSVAIDLKLGNRPKPKATEGNRTQQRRRSRSPFGAFLGGQRPNLTDQQGKDGHEYGGVYRSADGGDTWTRVNTVNPRPMYFSEIRVDPGNDQIVWVLGIQLWKSTDGGKSFKANGAPRSVHVDHHALWIDPNNGRHVILGNDGGVYVSYDGGKAYDHLNHVAIGQFYDVTVGPRRDYRVYGGLQDNGSWGGPSRVRYGSGPTNQDWMRIGGGDGFRCRVDANDPDRIYFESQNGAIGRRHLGTGERRSLRPRAPRGTRYRFNWNTPFVLSSHNSRIYYAAGNKVFRSLDRGNGMRAISPEITHTDRGSATALAESPLDEQVLYVGSDDGGFWMTRDGGHTWIDLYAAAAPTADKQPAQAAKPPVTQADVASNGDGVRNGHDDAPVNGKKTPSDTPASDTVKSDKPKDEEAAASELPEGLRRMLDRILQMDGNGDGAIQRDEMPERMGRMFERADANKDGVITREELIKALRDRPRRGSRGRRAPPSPTEAQPEAKAPKTAALPKSKLPSLASVQPDRRWVNWIEPSRFQASRVYAVFDGHRSDDDRPHIYVSEDHGAGWRSLRGNLPESAGTTRVLQEDLKNENLLYLGTEFGAWVSIDRGETWTRMHSNLPTVAVHAFAQHPDAGEIVAGTHGRSLWVLDVTTLRQVTKDTLTAPAHLFTPNTAIQWRPEPSKGRSRSFVGQNPYGGAQVFYALAKDTPDVALEILKPDGTVFRKLTAKTEAGLHAVRWDLRGERPRNRRVARRAQPGTYQVRLVAGGETYTQPLTVDMDPAHKDVVWMAHEDEAEEAAARYAAKKSRRYLPFSEGRDE